MVTSFPNSIYDPREIENVPGQVYDETKTTRLYAEDLNNSNNEIIAIEETLGENPQGDFDTVVERLNTLVPFIKHIYWAKITLNGADAPTVELEKINTFPSSSAWAYFEEGKVGINFSGCDPSKLLPIVIRESADTLDFSFQFGSDFDFILNFLQCTAFGGDFERNSVASIGNIQIFIAELY